MAGKNQGVLLLATIVIASISGICSAATYTVGDNTGWTIPSSASFYPNWASGKNFRAGDVLVFNFPAGVHTVAEVNRRNFDACNTTATIGPVQRSSPARITLTTAGTHYFLCTIPGHCLGNQKLSVVVTGSSAATPASSPTPSRGATTPATAPSGAATTPAASPTGGATTPAASPTGGATTPATVPTGGAITPTPVEGPSGSGSGTAASPPSPPSFATSTNVGLLSLVSVAIAALMF